MDDVFNDPDMIKKGVYPYEFVTDIGKLESTRELPGKDEFYSSVTGSHISQEEYQWAQHIWCKYGCNNLKDYTRIYLATDVCLLADIFQEFRTFAHQQYGLDPAHYISLPAFSWDAMLKTTGVKLELLTDPDKHLFFEKAIRGGFAGIVHRLAVANNPLCPVEQQQEHEESTYISYLDANNLYGLAMVQAQPISDFEWVDPTSFSIERDLGSEDGIGYALEVDLEYPEELHDDHADFPLAPEQMWIHHQDLSGYQKQFVPQTYYSKKLCQTLKDKTSYVLHWRNLKLYMELGMRVTALRRVMRFKESAWMAPYIMQNTELRKQATSTFHKDLFKLLNNSIFGKSMQNNRKQRQVELLTTEERAQKVVAKPHLKAWEALDESLVLAELKKPVVKLDRPIYVGFSVLELSKVHMYRFHYQVMRPLYRRENLRLLFTDTDSLCYLIKTPNMYGDMQRPELKQHLDLSNFKPTHPCHDMSNAGVLGKFKDESPDQAIVRFCGLRPKMYSILTADQTTKARCKGVPRRLKRKHDEYESCLQTKRAFTETYHRIHSTRHEIFTSEITKTSLCAFDDKRWLTTDGISSLPYGHYALRNIVQPAFRSDLIDDDDSIV